MRQAQTFEFSFKNVEKPYESYQGINVKLRFVSLCCTIPFILMRLQLLRSSDNLEKNSRYYEREGRLGTFLPYATRS